MAIPAIKQAMTGFERSPQQKEVAWTSMDFESLSSPAQGQAMHQTLSLPEKPADTSSINMISIVLDAFARDLGGRLDEVERHVIERSVRLEQMVTDMDQKLEANKEVPNQLERMEQSIQARIQEQSLQVEQLVTHHRSDGPPSGGHMTMLPETHSVAPSFGKEATEISHPSFGDELEGVVMSMQDEEPEWLGIIERHLQLIHGRLEEMALQSNNLHVKLNTVHNKVNDTNAKVNDEPTKVMLPAATAAPARAAANPTPSTPNSATIVAQNTDGAAPKPVADQSHRQDLVHALHGAMGHKSKAHDREIHQPAHRVHWQTLANSHWFTGISISTIVINGMLTGVEAGFEVQYLLKDALYKEGTISDQPTEIDKGVFRIIDVVFVSFWVIEIFLNALAQGKGFLHWRNPMIRWNMFDIMCVAVSIIELLTALAIAAAFGQVPGLGILRLMRVFRVFRVLRVMKVVKAFQGVRKLVIAVHGALLTLFWALVLLALLLYIFSIMITSGVSQHYESLDIPVQPQSNITKEVALRSAADKTETEVIQFYYGGIFACMATLYQAITGGDWTVMAEPVFGLSWTFYILWYGYIAFVLFGLLNVFTGIFVESATHAANSDREIKMQAQMEEDNSIMQQIRIIFARSDADGSGQMTESELAKLMEQDDFKEQMECLGIHPTEAHGLFRLLDDDCSGSVSIEEFLSGCVRLKGSAKAVDMITLLFETNKMSRKIEKIRRMVAESTGADDGGSPDGKEPRDDDSVKSPSSHTAPARTLSSTMSVTSF